ncbi:MAG: CtkA family protein [Clostridia bacterium]|nr:CtkA family protein [Clostridia bacterium]
MPNKKLIGANKMIDFTNAIEEFNNYKGSEKKKTLIYNDKKYLVKFPDPVREKNKNISYINNAFSEYIGSNVFKIVGFKTQNTVLGKYNYNGKEKIVCACEDFTDNDNILYEFENLALSTNPDKKIETELNDIMEVIEESKMIHTEETKQKFWDMFVIDSLIGNTDRHNGNWGFLLNKSTGKVEFSPIYDCGSALNPMLEDDEIEKINEIELKNLAMNCYSCLKEDGKKINYMTYIKQMNNENCNKAIKRIFKSIKLKEIESFIDEINSMTKARKEFYQNLIKQRYEIIELVYYKI